MPRRGPADDGQRIRAARSFQVRASRCAADARSRRWSSSPTSGGEVTFSGAGTGPLHRPRRVRRLRAPTNRGVCGCDAGVTRRELRLADRAARARTCRSGRTAVSARSIPAAARSRRPPAIRSSALPDDPGRDGGGAEGDGRAGRRHPRRRIPRREAAAQVADPRRSGSGATPSRPRTTAAGWCSWTSRPAPAAVRCAARPTSRSGTNR